MAYASLAHTPRMRSNSSGIACSYLLLMNILFLCVSASQASDTASNTTVATVDFVKGYATIFPENDSTAAFFVKRGMSIGEKDYLITGEDGFISLSFSTGTVVNIQPLSEVSMDVLDCAPNATPCNIVLDAFKGSINSNVNRADEDAVQFTINTPYASAAVRGTVFDIDVASERLLAGVTEGQVNVKAATGEVELPENFGTQVRENQTPSEPKPLLVAPQFIPGLSRYETGGEVSWESVGLAERYLVSFDNATGLVYREESAETLHRLRPLEVGTYAMHIRAIDNEGFKGQVAERMFDVVKTNNSRNGPSVLATIGVNDFTVLVPKHSSNESKIELNFSPSKEFDHLINLDVLTGEAVSLDRPKNSIFVRARGVLSNTEVTPFGPILEVPGIF